VPTQRLLFIGLDAADADLIERWCDEGWLPNISRMRSGGIWTRMTSTAEIFHVSAWPSIFTGTTPDKHGLYHAYVVRPGHQGLLRPRPDETPFPFVWKLLGDHGLRSVVVDAFLTCPLRDFHGVQIVDWGSWSWFWEPTMIPASLEKEVRRRFGSYPSEDHSKVGMVPVTDFSGFRRRLLAAVERKTALVKWLIEKEAWDFFLVVFGESHPAGHYFWHFFDSSYITHPQDAPDELRHALRDVYIALDRAVGELLRSVGHDTTVWLVSGDGMTCNYSSSHLLPDALTRMRLLNAPSGDNNADLSKGDRSASTPRDVLITLRNMVPERLRLMISRALLSREMQEQLSLRWKTAAISWPRTKAFVIENANEGYIRINLKGREPEGTVSPGPEYASLRDELCRTAEAMRNPANGLPAALAVHKVDEICNGPRRDHLPDIVIVWDPAARVTTELSLDSYGTARGLSPNCGLPPYYTGNHWPNAFAAAIGPAIGCGETLKGTSILDLAPTILARFGINPEPHMDGTPLSALTGRTGIAHQM
jgi:predicted AlkP superfamily phosphohydrolase/phosphomutase